MSYLRAELPPITITARDLDRLSATANYNMTRFPDVAEFLMREITRANIVPQQRVLHGVVRMGSKVLYRDEATGQQRAVVLVYPHEADIDLGRISVLTAVGAALIGLSVRQSIEFEIPSGHCRLTVLQVENSGYQA